MSTFLQKASLLVQLGDSYLKSQGPEKFHGKASALLSEAKLHELFNLDEFVAGALSQDFNPHQNYSGLQFSDLPVTVAMGERCFLDLYFWRRRPTVIHDHHFTGAFQCLHGNNVDLEFEFIASRQLGTFHQLGELKLKHERRLLKGHIAGIDLLDKFIHQNHHQADLTVNACFRTPDIGDSHLSNYLYSGLRFLKHPSLLGRGQRIMGFLNFGDFKLTSLDLNLDDALHFLIVNDGSSSQSARFLELQDFFQRQVGKKLGVSVQDLLQEHEKKMDEIENDYD